LTAILYITRLHHLEFFQFTMSILSGLPPLPPLPGQRGGSSSRSVSPMLINSFSSSPQVPIIQYNADQSDSKRFGQPQSILGYDIPRSEIELSRPSGLSTLSSLGPQFLPFGIPITTRTSVEHWAKLLQISVHEKVSFQVSMLRLLTAIRNQPAGTAFVGTNTELHGVSDWQQWAEIKPQYSISTDNDIVVNPENIDNAKVATIDVAPFVNISIFLWTWLYRAVRKKYASGYLNDKLIPLYKYTSENVILWKRTSEEIMEYRRSYVAPVFLPTSQWYVYDSNERCTINEWIKLICSSPEITQRATQHFMTLLEGVYERDITNEDDRKTLVVAKKIKGGRKQATLEGKQTTKVKYVEARWSKNKIRWEYFLELLLRVSSKLILAPNVFIKRFATSTSLQFHIIARHLKITDIQYTWKSSSGREEIASFEDWIRIDTNIRNNQKKAADEAKKKKDSTANANSDKDDDNDDDDNNDERKRRKKTSSKTSSKNSSRRSTTRKGTTSRSKTNSISNSTSNLNSRGTSNLNSRGTSNSNSDSKRSSLLTNRTIDLTNTDNSDYGENDDDVTELKRSIKPRHVKQTVLLRPRSSQHDDDDDVIDITHEPITLPLTSSSSTALSLPIARRPFVDYDIDHSVRSLSQWIDEFRERNIYYLNRESIRVATHNETNEMSIIQVLRRYNPTLSSSLSSSSSSSSSSSYTPIVWPNWIQILNRVYVFLEPLTNDIVHLTFYNTNVEYDNDNDNDNDDNDYYYTQFSANTAIDNQVILYPQHWIVLLFNPTFFESHGTVFFKQIQDLVGQDRRVNYNEFKTYMDRLNMSHLLNADTFRFEAYHNDYFRREYQNVLVWKPTKREEKQSEAKALRKIGGVEYNSKCFPNPLEVLQSGYVPICLQLRSIDGVVIKNVATATRTRLLPIRFERTTINDVKRMVVVGLGLSLTDMEINALKIGQGVVEEFVPLTNAPTDTLQQVFFATTSKIPVKLQSENKWLEIRHSNGIHNGYSYAVNIQRIRLTVKKSNDFEHLKSDIRKAINVELGQTEKNTVWNPSTLELKVALPRADNDDDNDDDDDEKSLVTLDSFEYFVKFPRYQTSADRRYIICQFSRRSPTTILKPSGSLQRSNLGSTWIQAEVDIYLTENR